MAFLARIGHREIFTCLLGTNHWWTKEREFKTMELILRDHPQSEVVMLAYHSDGPSVVTLSQLVRFNSPENADRLLELLPPDSGKWHSWPHVEELLENWETICSRVGGRNHGSDLSSAWYGALSAVHELNHGLNGEDHRRIAFASEDEIYVIADELYLRIW